ncbi:uncharacterized protein G2W53_021154 [Senna tora]|uniref:Uncharacterized protein n=1 Tax=Senna tora TaxID=362788 RepID=A0A834WGY2_9FABA|nr:uncharacterized protein G2W53_021154 [Senna tora]
MAKLAFQLLREERWVTKQKYNCLFCPYGDVAERDWKLCGHKIFCES